MKNVSSPAKGHWPAGKRRNDPGLNETQLRRLLARLETWRTQRGFGRRAIAEELGVDERTIRRWLASIDWPPQNQVRSMRQLVNRK